MVFDKQGNVDEIPDGLEAIVLGHTLSTTMLNNFKRGKRRVCSCLVEGVPATGYEKDLSLVVPLWNEEGNVQRTAKELMRVLSARKIDFEIVLVDNGSHDDTETEIDKMMGSGCVVKVVVPTNRGFGWGVLNGFRICRGEFLGFLVGYGAGIADTVRLYEVAKDRPNQAAVAVRHNRQDGAYRKILSHVYNFLVRALYGIRVRDVNGTPKIFPAKLLKYAIPRSKGSFFDAELLIKLSYVGCRIVEVPLSWEKRSSGRSKVKIATILGMFLDAIRFRFGREFALWRAQTYSREGLEDPDKYADSMTT
jgi:glycosyltransferase involved in cell wall biosynthesis